MGVTGAFSARRRSARPARRIRGLVVSVLVVLLVAAVVAYTGMQAFTVFGGNLNKAGTGAWGSLFISLVALVAALLSLVDLVYQRATGEHIFIMPFGADEHEPEAWLRVVGTWGAPVTVALGILIGKTVFT